MCVGENNLSYYLCLLHLGCWVLGSAEAFGCYFNTSLSSQVWFENTTTNIAFDTTDTLRKILHIKTLQNNLNKPLQK